MDVDELADEIVETAAHNDGTGLLNKYVYFEDVFDDVESVDAADADALVREIRRRAAEEYPDKRCQIHRSGSDPHTPLRTSNDFLIAVTVG
jgi:hypothetical protein